LILSQLKDIDGFVLRLWPSVG